MKTLQGNTLISQVSSKLNNVLDKGSAELLKRHIAY